MARPEDDVSGTLLDPACLIVSVHILFRGVCSRVELVGSIANNKADNFMTSGNEVLIFEAINYFRSEIFHHHHWQNNPFLIISFLRRLYQICPFLRIRPSGFHFFGFCNNNFSYRARSSALHPTSNLEDQVSVCPPVTGWLSYTPTHSTFSSPSTILRATVEVF
jgi:hypothetical protein